MNDRWEPLTGTDGDETMMDNPGDDDAGTTSAVKIKNPTNEAIGSRLLRTNCVVTVRIAFSAALVLVHRAVGGSQTTA